MDRELQSRLKIPASRLAAINEVLLDPGMTVMKELLAVVARYGTPEEINRKAAVAGSLESLLGRVRTSRAENLKDLLWLMEQRDRAAFIRIADYRHKVLGERAGQTRFKDDFAVTLEISGANYFTWIIELARRAIEQQSLMPGRYIQVRNMKEQEADGDLPAFAAAMQILGASYVSTLDTKGTDGSNVHLGGPETITGYFGGIGQPNTYALKWVDEFLYYYTNYGVREVLNVNSGTILLGYLLHRLGIDLRFKISVYMGNDNPYAALWTLIGAKLFSRRDGSSPLIGFNWSNSIDNRTMEITAEFRRAFGFEDVVRYEHHITETFKSIVRQPYLRRAELVDIADHVANISAKHEGADPDIDQTRSHPSDILDYFRERKEVVESGDWGNLTTNFLDKFDAVNQTAWALTEAGLSFVAAKNIHL